MLHPGQLSIKDFTYELPENKIAKFPLAERDASRLLIYKDGLITEDLYCNLAKHLPKKSLLIFNDTKVIEARIIFQKPSGGLIEVFCLDPHPPGSDINLVMQQRGSARWACMIGGAGKWKHGMVLQKKIQCQSGEIVLRASITERLKDSFVIDLHWEPSDISFAELLHLTGTIPLPPYIKRAVEETDRERYQTIYAHYDGSVAAPTAGLHFTEKIFESLALNNISHEFITLHVGAGTFKPVKSHQMQDHEMHAEYMNVKLDLVEKIARQKENIFCVGTTTLRSVESLYWLGVKLYKHPETDPKELEVRQWEPYESRNEPEITVENSLWALIGWMKKHRMKQVFANTQILIAPGYVSKIASGLITNFHQPQSTLLLLVAALVGNDWKRVYDYALANGFRFLSYGDGCLFYITKSGIQV